MGEITVSKTSGVEFISHQLLKFAANPNPVAVLISAFCDGLNTLQINNIIDVLNDFNARIDNIEEKTERKPLDKIVFEEDLLPVLQKAKDEVNEYKRKLYATFMAASIHPDSLNCHNKAIFFKLLDQLDYLSIYILNSLNNYFIEKQLLERIGKNYEKDDILVHLYTLESLALVDKIRAEEFEASHKRLGNIKIRNQENVFLYKRSYLGSQFLNFIIKGEPE